MTGVLEHEHFVESVTLMRKMIPGARKIALVFDDAKMWDPVRVRIMNGMRKLPDMQIVASDTIRTFADYKIKMKEYEATADIVGTLGIFNLKDDEGKNVADLFTVKKGDKVLISKYGGTEVKVDGEDHLIINETDILGIIG